jgi:hypothetical protein
MWLYNGKEVSDDIAQQYVGFVYIITNLISNKRYIGKKLFNFTRSKAIKGKTRRKRVTKESDWKTYFGSNAVLNNDVLELGQDKFKREILVLCKSKGTANYWEAKLQMEQSVLEKPDEYYNEWIIVKVHRSHIKSVDL